MSENWSVSTFVANPMLWTECVVGSIETEKEISFLASQRRIRVSATSGVLDAKHRAAAIIIRTMILPQSSQLFLSRFADFIVNVETKRGASRPSLRSCWDCCVNEGTLRVITALRSATTTGRRSASSVIWRWITHSTTFRTGVEAFSLSWVYSEVPGAGRVDWGYLSDDV